MTHENQRFGRSKWAVVGIAGLMAVAGGCASGSKDMREQAASGPVIINPRSQPETLEVNRYFQATEPHQVYAEVQSFSVPVSDVRLRFEDIPVEVPMRLVGGTTWRGELTSAQLKQLAVSGKTMEYDAQVVARDQQGRERTSEDSLEITIKAPVFEEGSG